MKTVNRKANSYFLLVGIFPVLFMWFIMGIIYLNTTFIEISNKEKSIPYGIYTDQELKGHSSASAAWVPSKGIVFSYMLQEGYTYPYTGVCFAADSGMLSFNSGSIFTIELSMQAAGVIPIIINESVKNTSGENRIRAVQYELKTTAGTHVYSIPLKAFSVPLWWYKNNQFSESDFDAVNFSNIQNICIQNSSLSLLNKKEHIVIKQISNEPDIKPWIWIAGIFSLCWGIGYGMFTVLKKKKAPVFIPYVVTETDEKNVDEWEKIRQYISFNYMNEIDMEIMEKELGIARHKIAGLIREHTTLIFKQYLNQIKVAEAKRLLLETNLPIGEIADQVGFGHLSNFNRVFKQYAGESPSDLRKQLNN